MSAVLPKDNKLKVSIPEKESNGYFHTWEKKIEVVTKYMALGNMRLVSELTKIPYYTLIGWKKEDWWGDLIDEIKKTRYAEQNTKLSKIVDKSLAAIEDRIDNGDFILNNKTGEVVRKPISIRDANTVARDLLNHQIKVDEVSNRMEERKENFQDTLKVLANEFAKWTRRVSTNKAETIDFKDLTDALHEEREAGLQDRGGEVHQQTSGQT
jgi:hypothetical protein